MDNFVVVLPGIYEIDLQASTFTGLRDVYRVVLPIMFPGRIYNDCVLHESPNDSTRLRVRVHDRLFIFAPVDRIRPRICFSPGCNHPTHSKCNQCQSVLYCSKKCQAADWATHKQKCKKVNVDSVYSKFIQFLEYYPMGSRVIHYPPSTHWINPEKHLEINRLM